MAIHEKMGGPVVETPVPNMEALLDSPDWTFQANKDMMRLPWRQRLRGMAALAKERGDENYLQTLRALWPIYLEREKRVNRNSNMQRL